MRFLLLVLQLGSHGRICFAHTMLLVMLHLRGKSCIRDYLRSGVQACCGILPVLLLQLRGDISISLAAIVNSIHCSKLNLGIKKKSVRVRPSLLESQIW